MGCPMNESEHLLRSVFLDAIAITDAPGHRAFLDKACAGDPALRAKVEQLINAQAKAAGFLPDAPKEPRFLWPSPIESAGDRIGPYKLLQRIGEGGCGVVYMAEQETPVRRKVALKVIKLGMDTKQVIARFEAERHALALMEHPNIANVLDAGATEAGRPFFVMELVRGVKITEYCDQHDLPTPARLDLFLQVCQAVRHAHQKGVIHRDLKPSNILVTVHDGAPVVKVIDFGIAKATAGRLTDQTLFTAFEQFLGTPAYMSPEQAAMASGEVDTRSDIYSLGVLLYELLTGSTPFDTKELLASGLDEMRRTILKREPMRPSTRLSQFATAPGRGRDTIHLVRGDLDWIVMKCLEKDRARRYETANGLAQDIRRHLSHEPIAARPPSRAYELQKLVRRHKVAFAIASIVFVSILFGLGILGYGLRRAQAERELARTISYTSDMALCWERWTWSQYASCRRLLRANIPQNGEPDLRSFEWWYLWRLCKEDNLYALGPTAGTITGLGLLSGDRLVAGCTQARMKLPENIGASGSGLFVWDWKTRLLLTNVPIGNVSDLSVSPDGQRIAVAGWYHRVNIYDGNTFGWITNYDFTNEIIKLTYSPDGRFLAMRGRMQFLLLDLASNEATRVWDAPGNDSEKPAFSPDGAQIAFMTPDEKISLWSARDGRLLGQLSNAAQTHIDGFGDPHGEAAYTTGNSFSPDGQWLASGDNYGRIYLQNPRTRARKLVWEHFGGRGLVAFSPDGKSFASGSTDGMVNLWQCPGGLELASCQGHESWVESLLYSRTGDYLFTGGKDGFIRVWDARPSAPPQDTFALARRERVSNTIASSDGTYMSFRSNRFGSPNGRITSLFDARPQALSRNDTLKSFVGGAEGVVSLGAKFFASRDWHNLRHVTDLETGLEVASYSAPPDEKIGAVSADGRCVAASLGNGTLVLRGPELSNPRLIIGAHSNFISVIEFAPDGASLATASPDGWLNIWDPRQGKLVAQALSRHRFITRARGRWLIHATGKRWRVGRTPISVCSSRRLPPVGPRGRSSCLGRAGQPTVWRFLPMAGSCWRVGTRIARFFTT